MAECIFDACCLINLYASGKEISIIQACGDFYVSEQVQHESLRIRKVDKDDPTKLVSEEIDLRSAIAARQIHQCQLDGEDELDAFVQFATELDDGEASCLAIAKSRRWTVATDDRKARRIASENGIALASTAELIHKWVNAMSPDEATVVELLRRIERLARFRPRRSDPLYEWWAGLSDKDGG